jgi:hypothetical protein
MSNLKHRLPRPAAIALGATLSLSACATSGGWDPQAEATKRAPMQELATEPAEFLRAARGVYVVVDLDVNRLRVMDGADTLWSAPVGTGTGLRLKGEDGEWHFSTPQGVFQIQYKEELPVWVLPDWYFVEKGLPVPPPDSKERRAPGQLGVAAVYLGEEIAIHGTERPELLGQRVSHGCIRLENRYAQRLFHNVQVGTPVVVTGGENLEDAPPPATTDPGRPKVTRRDTLAGYSTAQLLERVGELLASGDEGGDWVPLTSRLITRGTKDDAQALRGLLALAGTASTERLNREYATFLADAYSRGTLRAVVSLARIEPEERALAARAIVEATMALHPGRPDSPTAPWPTRRVPADRLGPDGQEGWQALRDAEASYRQRLGMAAAGGRP